MDKCMICHTAVMTAIACKLHGGSIHMQHCAECQYFDALTWHCLYYLQKIHPIELQQKKEAAAMAAHRRREQLHQKWYELLK